MKEIELKYKVKNKPKGLKRGIEIEQYYTKIEEDGEIRYRKKGNKYYKTEKKGKGLVREEKEEEITKEMYEETLKKGIVGNIIQKERQEVKYKVKEKEYTIEVDTYRGKQKGLVVAEIEFESVKESEEFKINKPEWLVEDITLDEGYKNKNLANG